MATLTEKPWHGVTPQDLLREWEESMSEEYPELPEALVDCIKRTIDACEDAIADPDKKIKATKAKLWLVNLKGWLPCESDK